MKVALPCWNDRISPVLDAAQHLVVAEIEEGRVARRFTVDLTPGASPITLAGQLGQLGVASLICGALSDSLELTLKSFDIRVTKGMAGPVDGVLEAFGRGEWRRKAT